MSAVMEQSLRHATRQDVEPSRRGARSTPARRCIMAATTSPARRWSPEHRCARPSGTCSTTPRKRRHAALRSMHGARKKNWSSRSATRGRVSRRRNWRRSAFLDEHEAFLEAHSMVEGGGPYCRLYRDHPYAQELFRAFGNVRAERFEWVRQVPVEVFLTMAESSTKTQSALARTGYREGLTLMKAYCDRHADGDGRLSIPYIAELYLAMRKVRG